VRPEVIVAVLAVALWLALVLADDLEDARLDFTFPAHEEPHDQL